ncbi:MAG: sulfatase-like hydrolase/transferase [Anaerolineaceae bacterium]|nr:sulfatase-like hydrolase/transferase [Anaerolineaceae bacterium]
MSGTRARPNIVFFFSDQQRWDTVGCYGQRLPVTPNLDRMAAEGVRFANAFTCQPVCGPARSCLQTGKFATETGCYRNAIRLPEGEQTVAHWMADAGYRLAYIGKWHLASTQSSYSDRGGPDDFRTRPVPLDRRGGWNGHWLASDVLESTSHAYDGHVFDADGRRVELSGYRADSLTDFALDYLRSRQDAEQPFFLFLSTIEPHHQNDHKHYEGPAGSRERFAGFVVPGDLEGTEGDWRQEYPDYLGCCNSLDANLGRIRAELERLGMADNTLVVYTSDHGTHFRTRNAEYKRSCHDASIRIPMIACGPGFTGGRVVEELVSLIDVPRTLLAAGGAAAPATVRGRAMQGLLDGSAGDWPQEVFVQISEKQVGRALRTQRWTYSVCAPDLSGWTEAASDVYVEEFLYDLARDPHQRRNLVADPSLASVRADLAERLCRQMVAAGEAEPRILSA